MKTNEKGITLTALVITIIVMVILAGITIGATSSKNNIVNYEQNITDDYGKKLQQHETDIDTLTDRVSK